MAHELRTPLSGVRGEAELALKARDTPPEVRESLEQILRATERMEAVIDTLLAAARNDARGVPGSADAAGAARLAVDSVQPVADTAGVQVALTEPDRAAEPWARTRIWWPRRWARCSTTPCATRAAP